MPRIKPLGVNAVVTAAKSRAAVALAQLAAVSTNAATLVENHAAPAVEPTSHAPAAPVCMSNDAIMRKASELAPVAAAASETRRWREIVAQLETKFADAQRRERELIDAGGIEELNMALGLPGATDRAATHRAKRREIAFEVEGVARAVERAKEELRRAEEAATMAQRESRIQEVKAVAKRAIAAARSIDQLFAALEPVARDYLLASGQLSSYRDLNILLPSLHRLRSGEMLSRAIFFHGEATGELLGLQRVAPSAKAPLAEHVRNGFHALMRTETGADRAERERVAIEEKVLEERADLRTVWDMDREQTADEIADNERKDEELARIVAERLATKPAV